MQMTNGIELKTLRCLNSKNDSDFPDGLLVDGHLFKGDEIKHFRILYKELYGKYSDLIRKYQSSVKDMVNDLFPV